jgi:uncharacterized protein (TIGR03437 family)
MTLRLFHSPGCAARLAGLALTASLLAPLPAAAQGWDPSGNPQLSGVYYFREVSYGTDQYGDITGAASAYGNITFGGDGTYSIAVAQVFDLSQGSIQQYSLTGTYSISSSGYGFMSSPNTELNGAQIFVLVSNGILTGSSTESGFNDFIVAAPQPSSAPAFTGSYSLSYLNFINLQPNEAYDALVQMTPNGAGSAGSANVTYYVGNSATPTTVSESKITYSISNGAVALNFPNSSSLPLTGSEYLYISPDGNFVFGGAPDGIDMFVGVRTGSPPLYQGIYYQSGLDVNESNLANNTADFDSFYGSYYTTQGANIIGHQRIVFDSGGAGSYTYSDSFPAGSNGTYTDTGSSVQYVSGNSGIVIGLGMGPYLGINVALPAPALSGSGVFLNPLGVVNAASFAPFTAGVSPREYLTLFGSGLAASPVSAPSLPFPTTLGNVQVLINNVAAPLSYVSPTQINLLVPAEIPETAGSIVQIQVINGSNASNAITEFVYASTAGVFSQSANGLGYAAALHNSDYSLVTPSNPAQPGETLAIFLTGLGDVSPSPPDGVAGPLPPSQPLSQTTNASTASIAGTAATVSFSGLAPGLAGYQIDLTVPAGLSAGDSVLEIVGADSSTAETLIPVGGSGTAAPASSSAAPRGRLRRRPANSRPPYAPMAAAAGTSTQARVAELFNSASRICNCRSPSANCGYSAGAARSSTE